MEKMKLKDPLLGDTTVAALQDEAFESLKKDEIAYPEIAKLGLTRAEVKKGMAVLLDFQEDLHICHACPGLKNCPKATPGFRMGIIKEDGLIKPSFDSCELLAKDREIRSRFILASFPEEWFGLDLKDVETSKSTRNPLLKEMVAIAKRESSSWLYVKGRSKSGKSYVLACFANRIGKVEPGVVFASSQDLFAKLKEQSFRKYEDKFPRNMELIKNASLLVLDEFGSGYVNTYEFENIIAPILSYRAENDLLTAFSSSLSFADVRAKFENKLGEKARALFDQIKLKMKSFDITGIKLYS